MRIAENIRVEMARRQMTGVALAELTGWPNSTLSRRLKGDADIPAEDLVHLAVVLELPLEQLLEGVAGETGTIPAQIAAHDSAEVAS